MATRSAARMSGRHTRTPHRGGGVGFRVLVEALERRQLLSGEYNWNNVAIDGGGFVTGIITSPTQKDVMYARTDVGGAYKWDPVDKRWTCITDFRGREASNTYGIESLAIDPSNPNRVYLGAGTYRGNQYWSGAYLLRSSDGGKTFASTDLSNMSTGFRMGANEAGRSDGERMAVDPNNGSILYYGTREEGLWKSTDYGASWAQVTSFAVPAMAYCSRTTNSSGVRVGDSASLAPIGISFVIFDKRSVSNGITQTIYVGVSQSSGATLYRSTNGGVSWTAVSGGPGTVPNSGGMNYLPNHGVLSSDGYLYISYGDLPGPNTMEDGAIWRYNTATGVWTNITPLAPLSKGTWDTFGYGGITIDAQNPGTLLVSTFDRWAGGDEIYRTTNANTSSVTWKGLGVHNTANYDYSSTPWQAGSTGGWMGDVEIDPFNSNRAYFVTGAGIYSTSNLTAADSGSTVKWAPTADGLEETVVLDLNSPTAGAPLLTGLGDIKGFRHDSLTTVPASKLAGGGSNTQSIDSAGKSGLIVARTGTGGGQFSTDGGTTWTNMTAPVSGAVNGNIAVSADGSTFVWAPSSGLGTFYSTNHGTSWTASTGLPVNLHVISDRVSATTFYAYSSGTFYVSTDGGKTFSAKAAGLPTGAGTPAASITTAGTIWLPANSGGLYRSTNYGSSFTQVTSVTQGYLVAVGMAAPGTATPAVYLWGLVGGVTGIFRSDNNGSAWTQINDAQHQYGWINVLAADPRCYGRVYLGTDGRGVVYGELKDTHPFVDGTYTMTNVNSGLQLNDPGTANSTQMIQSTPAITASQQWQFIYNGFGYYTIKNAATGLVLNSTGNTTPGTALQQWSDVSSPNLLWSFESVSAAKYVIRNKSTNLVIDISGASTSAGAGAILWTRSGAASQQWVMAPAAVSASQPFANGVYTFTNLKSGLVMNDPGTALSTQMVQSTDDDANSQKWQLIYQGNGYYTIKNVATGYVLNSAGSTTAGAPLQQWSDVPSDNLLWKFIPSGSGWMIQNKADGFVIDVSGGSTNPAALIDLWYQSGSSNQIWTLLYA